jgi:hypothetical protein
MTQNIKKINLKIHKIKVKVKINPLLKLHPYMFPLESDLILVRKQ